MKQHRTVEYVRSTLIVHHVEIKVGSSGEFFESFKRAVHTMNSKFM